MSENPSTKITCPKCNSDQLTANKKGFSGKNAVGGAILTGGLGLLAGTIGSNKIRITCLACGHVFKPGQGNIDGKPHVKETAPAPTAEENKAGCFFTIIILIALAIAYKAC